MPQRQLPIFPAGVAEINHSVAVQKEDKQVWHIHGRLPVFQHHEEDVQSFRMFTSQMILNGTVKPKETAKVFSIPIIKVKRQVKVFREQGAKGFYHHYFYWQLRNHLGGNNWGRIFFQRES